MIDNQNQFKKSQETEPQNVPIFWSFIIIFIISFYACKGR